MTDSQPEREKRTLSLSSHPVRGFIYQLLGWSMLVCSGLISFVEIATEDQGGPSDTNVIAVLVLVAIGGFLIIRGRRHSTLVGEQVLEGDERPPIVFLRSFGEEKQASSFWAYMRDSFIGRKIAGDIPTWGPVEQYLLAQFFSKIGPYIAIGQPGQPIPYAGASRIYLRDDEWRSRVIELLRQCQLVVLQSGHTPGLQWEVNCLVESVSPEKVLLILYGGRKDYAAFKDWVDTVIPQPMPEKRPIERLIMFADDWTPLPLPAKSHLTQTLAPLLLRNSIAVPKWKPSHMPKWTRHG